MQKQNKILATIPPTTVAPDPRRFDKFKATNQYWTQTLKSGYIKDGIDAAYEAKDGFAILQNPTTGQNEIFIRGTATIGDWTQNVVDGGFSGLELVEQAEHKLEETINVGPAWLQKIERGIEEIPLIPEKIVKWGGKKITAIPRERWIKKINKAIEENNVQFGYGHSRGGQVLADDHIKLKKSQKLGLDAAMFNADQKDIANIQTNDYFTKAIGLTGQHNITGPFKTPFHKAYHPGWD